MSQKMYTVTIGDEVLKYPEGTCYAEIVKKYQSTCRDPKFIVSQ